MFRLEKTQRPIALVALGHEIFAPCIPMGVRAEQRNFRSNIVRRVQSSFAQDMRRHGGSRRLAMHARDHDPAFARHDRRQRLGPADKLPIRFTRAHEDRILLLDRRRKDHHFGSVRIFRSMLRVETKTQPLQAVGFKRADLVGAAHFMPELEQERRDAAHPAPRHSHQVNPVMLARQELLQIDFRGERHDWVAYIFPSFPRRARLRFSAPEPRNFPPSPAVWPGRRLTPGFSGRADRPRDRTLSE